MHVLPALPITTADGRVIERLTGADYYMQLAIAASMRSRDPSTKVGAVIVRNDKVIGTGYNGFPRGIPDDPAWLEDRPTKYLWTVHAEMNAVLQAGGRDGCVGADIYVSQLFPCQSCALMLVAAGIRHVIYQRPAPDKLKRWSESFETAKQIFTVAKVLVSEWHDYAVLPTEQKENPKAVAISNKLKHVERVPDRQPVWTLEIDEASTTTILHFMERRIGIRQNWSYGSIVEDLKAYARSIADVDEPYRVDTRERRVFFIAQNKEKNL